MNIQMPSSEIALCATTGYQSVLCVRVPITKNPGLCPCRCRDSRYRPRESARAWHEV